MTDAPHVSAIFPRVLDATMLSDFRSCPHKFFRRHVQGLTRDRSNIHLHFGGAVASGLEAARREFCTSHDSSDALHVGCEALVQAWGDFDFTPSTRTEANKTLSNALLALQSYFHEWPLDDDPISIHHHAGEPCIEYSFALPLPNLRHPDTDEPLLYAGRFDFIGDFNSMTIGVDDKTTSGDPNNDHWRQQWKLRSQFSGYCWGAREYGLTLRGFMVRGIGVLKDSVRCGEAFVSRPDWLIDAWLAQTRRDVIDMSGAYLDWKAHYIHAASPHDTAHPFSQRFDNACADFGGCTYLDLCSSRTPDTWLSEYVVRRWDPLTRQES
jgi:hypothetical protein